MGQSRDLAWWRICHLPGQWPTPRGIPRRPSEEREGVARSVLDWLRRLRSSADANQALQADLRSVGPQRGSPVLRVRVALVLVIVVLSLFAARLVQVQWIDAEQIKALYEGRPVPSRALEVWAAYVGLSALAGVLLGRFSTRVLDQIRDLDQNLPAMTPEESYRAETVFVRRGVAAFLALAILMAVTIGPVIALAFSVAGAASLAHGPAVALWILESCTPLAGGRRVRFIPLLQHASRQQVLRQVGPVYQFRHAALQEFLASNRPRR